MLLVITRGALTTAHDHKDVDDDVSGSGVWRRVTEPRKLMHASECLQQVPGSGSDRNLQRILIGQFVVTHADSPAWPADTTNPSL